MVLTKEEINEIANHLDEIVGNNFHDAMYNIILQRESYDSNDEVSDEDILAIKEQLKRIL